jgi:hypothetical protein
MSIVQIPIQGSVAYEKVVYETLDNKTLDIHYLGDHHEKQTKCFGNVMTTISLLQSSLTSHIPIDVFIEIGIDVKGKDRDTYLNDIVKEFQKNHCLRKGLNERIECNKIYPDVRFHNVDFRHTLYVEYMTIVDHWWLKWGKYNNDMNHLLHTINGYVSYLVNNKASTLPYLSDFENDREMQRLAFVYDMVVYRDKRYKGRANYPFSNSLSEFMGDLYYFICSGYSLAPSLSLHSFYPRYIKIRPYYLYRLMHEYRNVPGCIKGVNIQDRFDMAINDILEDIKNTTTPHQFEYDTMINNIYANSIASTHISWLMDIYVCFRSLKSYMSHIIVVLGVDHIVQMKKFMSDLGILYKASSIFDNPGNNLKHGAQCISIPVDISTTPRLIFDDNVFPDIIPKMPLYHGYRYKKQKSRFTKKIKKR